LAYGNEICVSLQSIVTRKNACRSDMSVMEVLLDVCADVLQTIYRNFPADGSSTRSLLRCAIQLLGCPNKFGLEDGTMEFLQDLANNCGCNGDVTRLLRPHFDDLLISVTDDLTEENDFTWETTASIQSGDAGSNFRAFEGLISISGVAAAEAFETVGQVLQRHLAPEINPKVRLSTLGLLHKLLSDPDCAYLLRPWTKRLVSQCIVPNLVWNAGEVAASIRKMAIATLFSFLNSGGLHTLDIMGGDSSNNLLPTLATNIGDCNDESSRYMAVLCFGMLFGGLHPDSLEHEVVHALYPDLIQCLEDASNAIRLAACETLVLFLKRAIRKDLKGSTALDYMVERLLIHMDDPNESVREGCFNVLAVAVEVDKDRVMKKVEDSLSSYPDSTLCERLLKGSCL